MFQDRFFESSALNQCITEVSGSKTIYQVWHPDSDIFRHTVIYDPEQNSADCTCKGFTQEGFLCVHVLRVFNVVCVNKIPEQYILPRWTKDYTARYSRASTGGSEYLCQKNEMANSVWRCQMLRKWNSLLLGCQEDPKARDKCELAFQEVSEYYKILKESGCCVSTDNGVMNERNLSEGQSDTTIDKQPAIAGYESRKRQAVVVYNPPIKRNKGERNIRRVSIRETKSNTARAHIAKSDLRKLAKVASVQRKQFVNDSMPDSGSLAHPVGGVDNLLSYTPKVSFTSLLMAVSPQCLPTSHQSPSSNGRDGR